MTTDKRLQFQIRLSNAQTEATAWSLADTERVTIQLQKEIYGNTSNRQKRFKKECLTRLTEFESWFETIGIQALQNTIEQSVIHFGYPKMHVGSQISESIGRMGSGDTFTTDISERLKIANPRWVVWPTGRGNPPAVGVLTGKTFWFGSRIVQKPDLLLLGGPNPAPFPSTHWLCQVWLQLSSPISGFAFWVVLLIVPFRYLTVHRKISMTVCRWSSSAQCNSVRKPYATLPDTPVALTSASKYFQILPAPPGALKRALRLCKIILTCSWKNLQWWRCIQDATRFNY